jgi:hypothetical protein
MKRLALVVVVLFMLAATNSFAQNKLESWYTYWGLGYADVTYPDKLNTVLDELKELPGVDHTGIGLDMLGFYWPNGEKTIIGGILNGWGDRYEDSDSDDYMQFNGYLFSLSAMHFLTGQIGQGLFLRGDFGASRLVLSTTGYGDESSKWGFGGLLGAGFGVPISSGTRLLLNVNYSVRKVEGDAFKALQISVGGLF